MQKLDLSSIGITEEEIQNRVVASLVEGLMNKSYYDYEEGQEIQAYSEFGKRLNAALKSAIDAKFDALVESQIQPLIAAKVDALVIQQTNQWGEKKKEPVTFLEYLVDRADKFMVEPVDSKGRTREECERARDSFYQSGTNNRLAAAVDKAIGAHLQNCVNAVVKEAQSKVQTSLSEVLQTALSEAQKNLKVTITR